MRIRFSVTLDIKRDQAQPESEDEFDHTPTSGTVVDATIRDDGRYIGFTREEEVSPDAR